MVKIGRNLVLPNDAVTQTFGFLARKGAGKTYAASKLVEELVSAGAPVVVLDPVGTWWGLRVAANGRDPGLEIAVFGGEHGDLPVEASMGGLLAEVLVKRDASAVVDVSGFRKNERKRFVADFAEGLFHAAKTRRVARMVVFEEAQLFAPQRSTGEERMLGAVEDIVRLGRNYGLGATLISQRPQSVNKEVLNQVEALFVGQLSGPHERKAIASWVVERGADKGWLEELPSLQVGEMVVWSPQWLRVLKKVRIGKKRTMDASATPVLGGGPSRSGTLAPVDLEALKRALEDAQVREPGASPKGGQPSDSAEVRRLREELRGRAPLGLRQWQSLQQAVAGARTRLQELSEVVAELEAVVGGAGGGKGAGPSRPPPEQSEPRRRTRARVPATAAPVPTGPHPALKRGAGRMLSTLATFYPGTMTKAQVARASAMKASSGTFSTYWSTLRREGLLEEPSPGLFRASEAGLERLGAARPQVPRTLQERVAFWNARLKGGERRMLDAVLAAGSRGLTREELGNEVDMQPTSGTFSTYVSTLTRNRLVEKQGDRLVAHRWLLEGPSS